LAADDSWLTAVKMNSNHRRQSQMLHSHVKDQISCWATRLMGISIYIKENRTPPSPRRPLIGSSWYFTGEHGSSRAWKNGGGPMSIAAF